MTCVGLSGELGEARVTGLDDIDGETERSEGAHHLRVDCRAKHTAHLCTDMGQVTQRLAAGVRGGRGEGGSEGVRG